jgi:HAD superfamily hydrolase (TIGR01509 family)
MVKQVQWVLLDIDDTLIDYTKAHQIAFNALLDEVSQFTGHSKVYLNEIFKNIKKQLYERYSQRYNRHDKVLQIKLFCQELKIYSISITSQWINHYETVYLEHIECLDNTLLLLKHCKKEKISVILMTNNLLPIQLKVFQKFELEELVLTMLTSHEFTYEKPHPESLEYILQEFNIQPKEAIVIGDSPSDIAWGESRGIRGILYTREMDLIQHLT